MTTLITGNFQSYHPGGSPYSAYTGMWGHYLPQNDALVAESSMSVESSFPNGTVINWTVTPDPDWSGINGYLHVDYGNFDNSPGVITPWQVSQLTACSLDVHWTFSGNTASGLLSEIWLGSSAAASGVFTKVFEVGFLPKMSPASKSFAQGTTPIGTGSFTVAGTTWNVGNAGGSPQYIVAYRADLADHQGVLPYLQLLQFLVAAGTITGNEWVNGISFGVEPLSGAGSLTITSMSASVAGPVPVVSVTEPAPAPPVPAISLGSSSMTTLGDVTYDVLSYVYGFGVDRDKETALTSTINNTTDISFTVAEGAQIDRGFCEVDDELMVVQSADRSTGQIVLQPYGRGAQGSAKTTHEAGARVVSNPRFPRSRVKATINQVVSELYPQLFAVDYQSSQTVITPRVAYPLPADTESIISISVQSFGPSLWWEPITRYQFDNKAYTGDFNSGKSVAIFSPLPPGRLLKIVYRKRFGQFTGSDSQTFSSIGLNDDWRSLIAMGVQSRLLRSLDAPRLQLGSVESATRAQYNQPGSASQVARELFTQFTGLVAEERRQLLTQYPSTLVRQN